MGCILLFLYNSVKSFVWFCIFRRYCCDLRRFELKPTPDVPADVCNFFSILPQRNLITPADKTPQVQVSFRATREVAIKDKDILFCQVWDPQMGEDGEQIASIPIKLSAKAIFSRYDELCGWASTDTVYCILETLNAYAVCTGSHVHL